MEVLQKDMREFTKGLTSGIAKIAIEAIQRAVGELEQAEKRISELESALSEKSEIERQIREIIWLGEPGSILQAVKMLWGNLHTAQERDSELEAANRRVAELESERDGLQKRNDIQAGQMKHIDGEISPLMSEVARLKQELAAIKAAPDPLAPFRRQSDHGEWHESWVVANDPNVVAETHNALYRDRFNEQTLTIQFVLDKLKGRCPACNAPTPMENIGINWKPAKNSESEVVNG